MQTFIEKLKRQIYECYIGLKKKVKAKKFFIETVKSQSNDDWVKLLK